MFNFNGLIKSGSREEFLLQQLDPNKLPSHIAIIMDGNGRWAKKQGSPRIMGHSAGIKAVRNVVEASARLGISTLTLYTFSLENWKRPRLEVEALIKLLKTCLHKEIALLQRNNVQLRFIGRTKDLPSSLQTEIQRAIEKTQNNTGMILNIAFNYSSRAELVHAFHAIAIEFKSTSRSFDTLSESDIARHLYTDSDPDLLIRTSGEMRLSNFLLWQLAYTEIFVTETLWPDFNSCSLFEAILAFQQRERRFGDIAASK